MKVFIIIGGIVMAGLGGLGLVGVMSPSFDYEAATAVERQAWLDEEAQKTLVETRNELDRNGTSRNLFDVQSVRASDEEKLIEIVMEAKGASRTIIPKDFRLQFLGKMCPDFQRSPLSRHGFRLNMKMVRSNGDLVMSETVSEVACERYYAFKKRTR